MPDPKIIWESWTPLSQDNHDSEMPHLEEDDMGDMIMSHSAPIFTPIGTYNKSDPLSPINLCKCYWIHTNFKMDQRHNERLKRVLGAEILSVVTSYRLFIGIGHLFEVRDVRLQIQEALLLANEDEKIEEEIPKLEFMEYINDSLEENDIDIIRSSMEEEDYKRWAFMIDTDGEISAITTRKDNDKEYEDLLKQMITEAEEINGLCVTSEDGSVSI